MQKIICRQIWASGVPYLNGCGVDMALDTVLKMKQIISITMSFNNLPISSRWITLLTMYFAVRNHCGNCNDEISNMFSAYHIWILFNMIIISKLIYSWKRPFKLISSYAKLCHYILHGMHTSMKQINLLRLLYIFWGML